MNIVKASPVMPICLGRRGEKGITRVEFDLLLFTQEHGPGTAQLLVKRAGEAVVYPADLVQSGTTATWDIGAEWTATAGLGYCELNWYVGDTLAKSEVFRTEVLRSLEGETMDDAPDPVAGYVTQVLDAAGRAEEAQSAAEGSATEAHDSAAAAEKSAEAAKVYAEAAEEASVFGHINTMLGTVVAAEYDPLEDYSAGDLITYEGGLFRFKVDHTGIGEDLELSEVDEVTIAGELQSVRSDIGNLVTGEKKGIEIVVDDISPYGSALFTSYIVPKQDGTGDPALDNVRPISGHNEVSLTHSAANREPRTVSVALNKTIYGGTMNWNTGELVNDVEYLVFTGDENWQEVGVANSHYVFLPIGAYGYVNQQKKTTCSHFMPAEISSNNFLLGVNLVNSSGYNDARVLFRMSPNFTLAEWIAFLKEQNENGTPVQICFHVSEPQTIKFEPQPINVFVGETNTYRGNTGDTKIVYGREVNSAIKEIQNVIISLGGII